MIAKKHQIMIGSPAPCHSDRTVWARGLCKSCYNKWLKENNPEYAKRQHENCNAWQKKNSEKMREHGRKYRVKQGPDYGRNRHLRQVWGMTPDDYDQLLAKQDGKCAICQQLPGKKRLAIDHCHKTGMIRGLLCFRCNFGLSYFKESAEVMSRAAKYLIPKAA